MIWHELLTVDLLEEVVLKYWWVMPPGLTTGKTEVVKMTMVDGVGKIANKLVVDGQFYEGMVQGIDLGGQRIFSITCR